jgi:hypothetical protein
MNLEELAGKVLDAIESTEIPFMMVGALAAGTYGIPRSTRDVDFLVPMHLGGGVSALIQALDQLLVFDAQAQFDTLTWGRRHVGVTHTKPSMKVELFEIFDDPFVQSEFGRRQRIFVPMLGRHTWIPTAEDVIVQKLRWGRPKDLEDVRDILAVQEVQNLDMPYIRNWCEVHQTTERLTTILANLPVF